MRIIFMGTPVFAVPSLTALVAAGHDVVAVYTQPPRPAGRGKALALSPVQRTAETMGLIVRNPASLRDTAVQAEFAALGADVAVVAAYGLILPKSVLAAPLRGCINVHASLLPRWRGAAPIQRAILAGDAVTGVTIMAMEAGLDTGPMLATVETPVTGKTAGALTDELADLGARLLTAVIGDLPAHRPVTQPDQGVTHAMKIDKTETRLDFLVSASQVERQIRAFAPAPGAFFELCGERFRVLSADVLPPKDGPRTSPGTTMDDALTVACNPGAIRLTTVQRAGRGVMASDELLRGFAILAGTRLG